MNVRCPGCQAEQQQPAAGAARPLCMRCGESLASVSAAPAPAAKSDNDFSARTMSMVRPSLDNIDSLPALSALVAQASAEAQAMPPAPPVAAQQKQWHVRTGAGAQSGPLSTEEVQQWMADGRLDAATIAWRPGQADWQPLAQAMAAALPSSSAQTPPARPQQAEAASAAPRAQATDSFLAPADGADSDFTSVSARPTVMVPANKRRWPAALAATAAVLGLSVGAWMVSRVVRTPAEQQAAVVSDVPTPAAAPAPTTEAETAPAKAPSEEGKASDDEVQAAPKEKKAAAHKAKNKRHRHRHRPRRNE